LYLRYHLLVAYLLDRRGLAVRRVLRDAFDPSRLAEEILAEGAGTGP
jgi:hypothetical protein